MEGLSPIRYSLNSQKDFVSGEKGTRVLHITAIAYLEAHVLNREEQFWNPQKLC